MRGPGLPLNPIPKKTTEEHVRLTDYDEETVLEIAEAGYNFVRVSIDTRYFFSEDEYIALPYVGQDFYGNIDTANLNQY